MGIIRSELGLFGYFGGIVGLGAGAGCRLREVALVVGDGRAPWLTRRVPWGRKLAAMTCRCGANLEYDIEA